MYQGYNTQNTEGKQATITYNIIIHGGKLSTITCYIWVIRWMKHDWEKILQMLIICIYMYLTLNKIMSILGNFRPKRGENEFGRGFTQN